MMSARGQAQRVFNGSMRNERTSFGKYQVLARLGQGGMGHVYLAMNSGPAGVQKLIVIKQLREDFATSVAARAMFLDEARIATRLNHPNIVQTNEVVDDYDDLYLVMEFLDGQPLSRILEAKHTDALPLPAKLRVLVEALEGLQYAHELSDYDGTMLNVVHRDVSPQNIVVTYDGHVKLVDFGVAKAADATTVTESGVFKGKVRYASPEQALCLGTVDRRADVFAVGTILWEILAGRRLWMEQADASVLLALASGQVPRIRDTVPDVAPALEAICNKALAVDVNARFATALEMRNALVEYLRDQPDTTDMGVAIATSFAAERRRLHAVIDGQVKAARETSTGALTVRHIPLLNPESSVSGALASEKSIVRGGLSVESQGHSRVPPEEGGPPRSRSVVLVASGVLAAAILGFTLLVPKKGPAAPAAPPTAAPADAHVHLSLRAAPASAHFTLDGKMLGATPYEGDVARDDAPHRLTIRADGFESRDIDAHLGRDVSVDVTLAPLAAPPPAVPPSPAAPSPGRPAVYQRPAQAGTIIIAPKGTPQSQRHIDEDDPYKR